MNVEISEKRLQQYRSHFQDSSKTHSHTFYQILGKIVAADFEKIGEFPKNFPSNISRTVRATTTKLGSLEQNIDPHTCYFFKIFGQGVEEPGYFQFSKKVGGG